MKAGSGSSGRAPRWRRTWSRSSSRSSAGRGLRHAPGEQRARHRGHRPRAGDEHRAARDQGPLQDRQRPRRQRPGRRTINIASWPVNGMYQPDAIAAYQFRGRDVPGHRQRGRRPRLRRPRRRGPGRVLRVQARPHRLPERERPQEDRGARTLDRHEPDGRHRRRRRLRRRCTPSARAPSRSGTPRRAGSSTTAVRTSSGSPPRAPARGLQLGPRGERDLRQPQRQQGPRAGGCRPRPGRPAAPTPSWAWSGSAGSWSSTSPAPGACEFETYVNPRDFMGDPEEGTAGDLGPEGLHFVPAWQSPTRKPLLLVGNEVSGTTTTYEVTLR